MPFTATSFRSDNSDNAYRVGEGFRALYHQARETSPPAFRKRGVKDILGVKMPRVDKAKAVVSRLYKIAVLHIARHHSLTARRSRSAPESTAAARAYAYLRDARGRFGVANYLAAKALFALRSEVRRRCFKSRRAHIADGLALFVNKRLQGFKPSFCASRSFMPPCAESKPGVRADSRNATVR